MKERHWTSLVTSLRHGQCVLLVGHEIAATPSFGKAKFSNYAEALALHLGEELEDDGRRVTGATLAAVAQQYEDAQGFGPNALRALAQKFYHSRKCVPSDMHRALASLPISLIVTTCHDDLLSRALQEAGKSPLVKRYHLRGDKRDNPEFMLSGAPNAPVVTTSSAMPTSRAHWS